MSFNNTPSEGVVRSPQSAVDIDEGFAARLAFFGEVLRRWTSSPNTTIACGSWSGGTIAEFVPGDSAEILPPVYSDCFEGIRELRFAESKHHLHVDLGRVHSVVYCIAPSVCFGGRPSFEVRFLTIGAGGAPSNQWTLSLMLTAPYLDGDLDLDHVRWFLDGALTDVRQHPGAARFEVDESVFTSSLSDQLRREVARAAGSPETAVWGELLRNAQPPSPPPPQPETEPLVLNLLGDALRLPDAALVVFRDRLLLELQTEQLDGVHRYVEDGHVSWQVGATRDHHCHLALTAVTHVEFAAEPTPCQGGRPNYTLWFLVPGQCGNPHRADGYFSIVLNHPYRGGHERYEVIEPMLDLYRRYASESWVSANPAFAQRVRQLEDEGGDRAATES